MDNMNLPDDARALLLLASYYENSTGFDARLIRRLAVALRAALTAASPETSLDRAERSPAVQNERETERLTGK